MRWSDRQQAMLREMGIRLWLPPDPEPAAEVTVAEPVAQTPAPLPHAAADRADWLIVGDAPDDAHRDGDPFAGRAGQLLDNMLRAAGLARDAGPPARRAHAVRAAGRAGSPGDRDAGAADRIEALLRREIELVQPRLVVALGRGAAQALLQTDEPFGRLRGRVHRYRGLPLVVTFAPAYLLRHPEDKAGAWDDLCLALQTVKDSSPD